jgi:hypothetical protein
LIKWPGLALALAVAAATLSGLWVLLVEGFMKRLDRSAWLQVGQTALGGVHPGLGKDT